MVEFKILITDGLDESGQAILHASEKLNDRPTLRAGELLKAVSTEEVLNALLGKSLRWKVS